MQEFAKIAIFPIPDMVAFPGTVVPLHVFEPRYRKMVEESVARNQMIAVCNIEKQISPAKKNSSLQEVLTSNQATYQPRTIFSAGFCNPPEKTKDGRLYVTIHIAQRYKLIEEIQTLPYRIAKCSELHDDSTDSEALKPLQTKIVNSLTMLTSLESPPQVNDFDRVSWLSVDPISFSFKIFQLLRFDSETMQTLLEMTNPKQRLNTISEILNQI
ncbi:MAG: carboligase [Porticoccaceae bacterium]|nr:carboligase [Porticoccaceae bacterium]|tara:strand:- start:2174 stop:2815 length:642 start_codon:yes stop_codon:yes gene_type:complete